MSGAHEAWVKFVLLGEKAQPLGVRVCCTDLWHLRWRGQWPGWKDVAVPKPFPKEFREDVVRVARDRGPGVTLEPIATDFGVTR